MNINSYTSIRVIYTIFIIILIPIYWKEYGSTNFLWFSDVTLFLTLVALWTRSNLPVSIAAIWFFPFAFLWNICFFSTLIFGFNLLGITNYMFDTSIPLYVRGLSLFHVWLPPLLIWLLYKLSYNNRALLWICILTWILLPITYLITEPEKNINWVFGLTGETQNEIHPLLYLALLMIIFPIFIYFPMHNVLKRFFQKKFLRKYPIFK